MKEISYDYNYELFFENSIDLLCFATLDGKFQKLNSQWEQTLGYSLQELEGKPFIDFIHPDDIERVLLSHPRVAEAVVVGIPDKLRGETVRAVVRLKEAGMTEEELKRFCREYIADYKIPRQIIFADSLPRTSTGEIHKEELIKSLFT